MKNRYFQIFAFMIFAIIILFFVMGIMNINSILNYVHGEHVKKEDIEVLGVFGDSAGLLNALFSSLAFGGVILTIIWQVTENNKQRADEHRIQFENVFFNMTNTFEHIISELKVKRETDNSETYSNELLLEFERDWEPSEVAMHAGEKGTVDSSEYVTGREVFKYLYEERAVSIVGAIESEGIIGFEKQMSGVLDNYFRYLYRILKYIDDSKLISNTAKYYYAGILRAHLSYMELLMIYYNGLSKFGRRKMKPLIERYHLLKNIRVNKLYGQTLNAKIKFMDNNELYDEKAWQNEMPIEIVVHNKIEQFYFRIAYAVILALIFNTLFSDWWHANINFIWMGMSEIVVRGIILVAIVCSMLFYQYRDKVYQRYFEHVGKECELWKYTWNTIKGNYTIPIFLFLILTSYYTIENNHAIWYDTHTVYIDLSILYFPLMADVFALIVNVVRKADAQKLHKDNLTAS